MIIFQQAFEQLLSSAPGPVFPRARALYLRKYCLEGTAAERFRTFLLQEEIQEASDGAMRMRALSFALVHWQGPQLEAQTYQTYLEQHWQLRPDDLTLENGEPWFRDGGAWCRFTAAAVYERAQQPTTLLGS
jgi:hypothetical protein